VAAGPGAAPVRPLHGPAHAALEADHRRRQVGERAPRLPVHLPGRPGRLVRRSLLRRHEQAPRLVLQHGQNPDRIWIELDGRKLRVAAETVTGEERERAWRAFVARWPGYDDYQARTDRFIPVVKLTPA
jgi:hypothetical protein